MADVDVTGDFGGPLVLSAPTGTAQVLSALAVSKEVAFAVEGPTPDTAMVSKISGYGVTGVQQDNIITGKCVAYAVLEVMPVNRRRASWLFVGDVVA